MSASWAVGVMKRSATMMKSSFIRASRTRLEFGQVKSGLLPKTARALTGYGSSSSMALHTSIGGTMDIMLASLYSSDPSRFAFCSGDSLSVSINSGYLTTGGDGYSR